MLFKGLLFLSWRPFCSAKRNHFSNFGRVLHKKHFCEIILKSGHWPRNRCRLNVVVFSFSFLALAAILFSGAEPF